MEGKKPPSNAVTMEALSERYGWTPEQIRQQRIEDIEEYTRIISIKNKLAKRKHGR